MLSSDKSNIFVSGEVGLSSSNLSSGKVGSSSGEINLSGGEINLSSNNLSSMKVNLSKILILKSIVCCVCVMFSSDVSYGMNDEKINNNLNKENDEIEINVEKASEVSAEAIDTVYKVFFLGNKQIGKTHILKVATKGSFDEQYTATVGFDFYSLCYKYTSKNNENTQFIRLQIWDTSGQEQFKSLTINFIKQAHVVVLVYDITNKTSFDNIQKEWLEPTREQATKDAVYFLVGNKTDLGNDARKVSQDDAQNFATANNNMTFFEVSAKDGNNIDNLFKEIAKACIKKYLSKKPKKDIVYLNFENIQNTYSTNTSNHEKTTNSDNCCSCCPCYKDKE